MKTAYTYHSVGILFPVIPAQVGVSEAEQVLCNEQVPIAQIITVGLGLYAAYLILKFVLRLMKGFDKAGSIHVKRGYFAHQVKDSSYSLLAALLPVFIPVFLNVIGIDVVECLF